MDSAHVYFPVRFQDFDMEAFFAEAPMLCNPSRGNSTASSSVIFTFPSHKSEDSSTLTLPHSQQNSIDTSCHMEECITTCQNKPNLMPQDSAVTLPDNGPTPVDIPKDQFFAPIIPPIRDIASLGQEEMHTAAHNARVRLSCLLTLSRPPTESPPQDTKSTRTTRMFKRAKSIAFNKRWSRQSCPPNTFPSDCFDPSVNILNHIEETHLVWVDDLSANVPALLFQIATFLQQDEILRTPGLFRKSGLKSRACLLARDLSAAINATRDCKDQDSATKAVEVVVNHYRTQSDIPENTFLQHDLANIFKTLFRQFTIPNELIPLLQECTEPDQLRDFVLLLPRDTRNVLRLMVVFLARAANYEEFTMMGSANLARCFAPNLLDCDSSTVESWPFEVLQVLIRTEQQQPGWLWSVPIERLAPPPPSTPTPTTTTSAPSTLPRRSTISRQLSHRSGLHSSQDNITNVSHKPSSKRSRVKLPNTSRFFRRHVNKLDPEFTRLNASGESTPESSGDESTKKLKFKFWEGKRKREASSPPPGGDVQKRDNLVNLISKRLKIGH